MNDLSVKRQELMKVTDKSVRFFECDFDPQNMGAAIAAHCETVAPSNLLSREEIARQLEAQNPTLKAIMDQADAGEMEFFELPDLTTEDEILAFLESR